MPRPVAHSGDIVFCHKTENPQRPILITHYDDGTLTADCSFLQCPFLDKCKLSRNSFVKQYLDFIVSKDS